MSKRVRVTLSVFAGIAIATPTAAGFYLLLQGVLWEWLAILLVTLSWIGLVYMASEVGNGKTI